LASVSNKLIDVKHEIPNSKSNDSFVNPSARVNVNLHFIKLQVVRLSAATQDVPRSIICNVHGVNPRFLEVGKAKHAQQHRGEQAFAKGAYYIGKMVWSKGYSELLQLLSEHQDELSGLQVDLYGNGEDSDQVKKSAEKLRLKINVYPGRDHADPLFHE